MLTLLFAPRDGAGTRRLLGRKVKDGENWIKDKAAVAEDYILSQGKELRDRARKVVEVGGRI